MFLRTAPFSADNVSIQPTTALAGEIRCETMTPQRVYFAPDLSGHVERTIVGENGTLAIIDIHSAQGRLWTDSPSSHMRAADTMVQPRIRNLSSVSIFPGNARVTTIKGGFLLA